MYFANDLYPHQATTTNRSVHSEAYFNPKERINIVENKMCNGMYTYNPSKSVPHTPVGTIRRNRLKLFRTPNFRISFGEGGGPSGVGVSGSNSNSDNHNLQSQEYSGSHQGEEQLYVKVGETIPSSEAYVNWGHDPSMFQQQQQRSIYQSNYRQDNDKDVIYAPTENRNISNCMNSNTNRFNDV